MLVNQTLHSPLFPSDIPLISPKSGLIFSTFAQLHPSANAHDLAFPLSDRAASLQINIEKLKEAENNVTKNKIFAVLKSALHITIMVAGVLGAIALSASPAIAIGVALGTLVACSVLGCYYLSNTESSETYRWCGVEPIAFAFIGSCIPIFQEFGKVNRLKENVNQQAQVITETFRARRAFFEQNFKALIESLTTTIAKSKHSLNLLRELPPVPKAILEIEEIVKDHEKALIELEISINYYRSHKR